MAKSKANSIIKRIITALVLIPVTIGVMSDLSDTNTFEPIYQIPPHQGGADGASAFEEEEIYLYIYE